MHLSAILLSFLPLAYASPIASRCSRLKDLAQQLNALAHWDRTAMTERELSLLEKLIMAQPVVRSELEKCSAAAAAATTVNHRRGLGDVLEEAGETVSDLLGTDGDDSDFVYVDVNGTDAGNDNGWDNEDDEDGDNGEDYCEDRDHGEDDGDYDGKDGEDGDDDGFVN